MQHKVAFVGPVQIYDAFGSMFTSWDLQTPLETLADLYHELDDSNDNPKLDAGGTSVIILFSTLYNKDPQKFAEIVSFLAPYAAVCILIPESQKVRYSKEIQQTIKRVQFEQSKVDDSYNYNTPFFMVTYENAIDELEESFEKYIDSPMIEDEVKVLVKAILDDMRGVSLDEFEEDSDEDIIDLTNDNSGAGKVITFTSSKGGAGKSTMSLSCGAYLLASSKIAYEQGLIDRPVRAITVDLDVKDGQLSYLNGAKEPNVVDIFSDLRGNVKDLTQENIKKGIWHNERSGMDFIFAPKVSRNGEAITPAFYAEVIKHLKSMYDYVILDTSVNYLEPLFSDVAYPMSDKIVLVTDIGISAILGMNKWIREFVFRDTREHPIEKDNVGIVINKFMLGTGVGLDEIQRASNGIKILSFIPNLPKLITTNANSMSVDKIIYNEGINKSIESILTQVLPDEMLPSVPYEY